MITIDLLYLMSILLPIDLRLEVHGTFVEVMKNVLQPLYTNFYDYFNQKKYELTFNGQVILLEHLLNDYYDNVQRRIHIDDSLENSNIYIFNKIEGNEKRYLFNSLENGSKTYLFNKSEIESLKDFTIFIPSSVAFGEVQLKKLVDKYKLPGKSYNIQLV